MKSEQNQVNKQLTEKAQKNKTITIRTTQEELEEIKQNAQKMGMNTSNYIIYSCKLASEFLDVKNELAELKKAVKKEDKTL